VSVWRLARGLADSGVDVAVVAPGASDRWTDGSIEVFRVEAETRFALLRGFRRWKQGVERIARSLEPDVVHGHGLPRIGIAAVHGDYAARRVITVHGNVWRDVVIDPRRPGTLVRRWLRDAYAKAATGRADAVIGVHPDWRINLPLRVDRFAHIPNIVDSCYYEATPRPVAGRVLYCGGPRRIKGWHVLRAAWGRVTEALPEAHLDVVGWTAEVPDPLRTDASVSFHGWLPPAQSAEAMARAQAVVIPSRYEVAPLVLGEAWALRVAVVATSVGGLASLAGGAALLVPRDNPEALGEALVSVLGGRTDVSSLVADGYRRARSCTSEQVVHRHLELYEDLMRSNARSARSIVAPPSPA
jgi:glycosyltransferase involved in cell wall biosynthesis